MNVRTVDRIVDAALLLVLVITLVLTVWWRQ